MPEQTEIPSLQVEEDPRSITVLEKINQLLSENDGSLQSIHSLIISNEFVIKSGYTPTLNQVRKYFSQLLRGLEYLNTHYGREALISNIVLYQETRDGESDHIGYYSKQDELGISLEHIAVQCSNYSNSKVIFEDSHLAAGTGVIGENYTTLQAIEEGYHRYQDVVLHMDPGNQGGKGMMSSFEIGVIPVYEKAIADLGIELFLFSE